MTDFEHFPGCAHIQNMARPRSQRLIGPQCHCAEAWRALDKLKDWLESDEGKAEMNKISEQLTAQKEQT